MADRDALINALAGGYYSASDPRWLRPEDLRNRLAPNAGMPTLPPMLDNRPSLRSYGPQQGRPHDAMAPVAEALSPMGAYGLAGLATTAAMDARQGKYDPNTLLPLAFAAVPVPGAKGRFTPALRLGEELFTGNISHVEAYHKLVSKYGERVAAGSNVEDGFLGADGRFLTRHEAQAALGGPQYKDGLMSHRLPE